MIRCKQCGIADSWNAGRPLSPPSCKGMGALRYISVHVASKSSFLSMTTFRQWRSEQRGPSIANGEDRGDFSVDVMRDPGNGSYDNGR